MKNFSDKEAEMDERLLKIAAGSDEFEVYQTPHAARIALLADALAQHFDLASHDRFSLRQAALIHDLGEVSMNREYIGARRMLRDEEILDVQRHTVIGEQEAAKLGLNRAVQLLVRWHHEWWSGNGYPDALAREQIPLAARILRVADTYDAMTSRRPFREAIPEAQAKQYLIEWAGIEFDPKVVKAFGSVEIPAKSAASATENGAANYSETRSSESSLFNLS